MIDIIKTPDNRLILKGDQELIADKVQETGSTNYRDWFNDNESWDSILWECLESYLCNGYSIIDPCDIGALTDALIITDNDGNYWWDTLYALKDLLEETLTNGNEYQLTRA